MPATVAHATKYIASVDLSSAAAPKTAVIIGATFGIGAHVAQCLAKTGCHRLILCGRTESRAAVVIDKCKAVAKSDSQEFVFVKGDVSNVAGMRKAVQDIVAVTGKQGIDYLFMTQNGIPSGKIEETTDGLEVGFAVQAVSRFVVAYLLTTGGYLKVGATVVTVANTGQTLPWLTVDDLSLKERAKKRGKIGLFMDQSFRDSCVLDAWHLELQSRYPEYHYLHIHPGLVKTENFDVTLFPFPLSLAVRLAMITVATTPEYFVPVPVYLGLCSDEERNEWLGSDKFFAHTLSPAKPGAWASDATNRKQLWEWLVDFTENK